MELGPNEELVLFGGIEKCKAKEDTCDSQTRKKNHVMK